MRTEQRTKSEGERSPAASLLEIARAREGPQFFIVDANMTVLHQHVDVLLPEHRGELPGDVALTAIRLMRGPLQRRSTDVALVRPDLALRMIRLADDGSCYALFLEAYQARDLVRTAVQCYHLSARESAVLDRMLHGYPTVAIAAELGIEPTTVLQHIKNIGLKIGVTKRSAIVAAVLGTMPVAVDDDDEAPSNRQRRARSA
ncbi:MAG: Bacterial regulatory protein luxR family [Candidatus Eremiobacteraeota bacterium]|nr:Bacterial regulatory protein luxR family [Candidatus Eremiobacteraeota bacterium]